MVATAFGRGNRHILANYIAIVHDDDVKAVGIVQTVFELDCKAHVLTGAGTQLLS